MAEMNANSINYVLAAVVCQYDKSKVAAFAARFLPAIAGLTCRRDPGAMRMMRLAAVAGKVHHSL
jgi:hypothetical protein